MMRLTRAVAAAVLVVVVLAGLLPTRVLAQGDQSGVIEGQVTNGTADAPAPANLEVVIHVLQNRAKVGERRVLTDGAGHFRADGLATGPDMLYFPIAEYGGVPYFPAQPVVFQSSDPVPAEITVFEPTPTADALSFERLNMLLMNVTPTALTVMEMGAVVNAGDRTYAANPEVTGSARTLRFTPPPGAIQITGQAGLPQDTLESTGDGFATTDPIRPGRREIAYSYQLPYDTSTLDFARTFAYPVGTFTVYLPEGSVQLDGPGLLDLGTADFGGRTFRQYAIQNVAPGAEARFRLTGLPAPFFARHRDLGLAVVGVASVALLGLLLVAFRRRASSTMAGSTAAPVEATTGQRVPAGGAERLALLRTVAELDERYEAGAVEEETYRAEREAHKSRLLAMARSSANT